MRTITQILSTISILATASASFAAQTMEVEGMAAVVNGDIAMARDRAIDDAKRKAVEQIAGAQVSAETITENFELVQDKIYSRASGFVKTYSVISEFKDEDTYRVKIKATVDEKAVAVNLEQIFKVKPRVIVLVAEQNVGAKGFSYWWGSAGLVSDMDIMQTALIQIWQPRGFKFIDPGMLKNDLKVQGAVRKPGLSNKAALSLGKDADADVAIVGKVLVSDAGPVMSGVKMHSYHAVGTLRALNIDTGEIIAVADDTGVAPHIDPNMGGRVAIKALAKKIGSNLEKKIMAKWTAEAASAREIDLKVTGVKKSKMLRSLEKVLREEVRGVESARVRRRKKGRAYFNVKVRATSAELGRDLESKTYEGFKVEVVEVTKSKLTINLTAQ